MNGIYFEKAFSFIDYTSELNPNSEKKVGPVSTAYQK